jgi:hypothetical protein
MSVMGNFNGFSAIVISSLSSIIHEIGETRFSDEILVDRQKRFG